MKNLFKLISYILMIYAVYKLSKYALDFYKNTRNG